MVFLSDGLSTSARETIFDGTAPGVRGGDLEFTVEDGQSVGIHHM